MPRAPNSRAIRMAREKLTEKETAFVNAVLAGKTCSQAVRAAGYSDVAGEVNQILARAPVAYAIIEGMRPAVASWRLIALKVKRWLNTALDGTFDVTVREGETERTQTVIVRPSERNKACEIIVGYLSKAGMGGLMQEAERQDAAEGDIEAIARQAMSSSPESDTEN